MMNTSNLLRVIKAFAKRKPFRPYLIELVSGDRIHVTPPEAVGLDGDLLHLEGLDGRHRLLEASAVCQVLDRPKP
jgi:hypothetical protein